MRALDRMENLVRTTRRHGWRAAVALLRQHFLPSSPRLCLFGLTAATARVPPPALEGLVEEFLSPAEAEPLRREGWLPEDVLQRLADGERCLLQRVAGRIVGIGWLSTRPEVELGPGVRLLLPADSGYTYQSWTEPAMRGNALQARRALAFLRAVQREGRERLLLYTGQTKFESQRGVRKAGYRQVGWIDLRLRGDEIEWRTRIADPSWTALVRGGERGRGKAARDVPDPPRQRG